ncbi:MAG: HNH endonuclease [Cyclobacteriaceae bacterium]|nr:HNH endonuclease [Cyclobacteriaceae bacterium]
MNQRALILNKDYRPIATCEVHRAFVLVYMEKVDLVENYSGSLLRTVDRHFSIPAVVRLQRYINMPFKHVALTRVNVFKRDGFQCQYCGTKKDLSIDHVLPRARGGKTTWKNLVAACKRCNASKGDRMPAEADMRLAQQPYKPSYLLFLREMSGDICEEWMPYLGMNGRAGVAV